MPNYTKEEIKAFEQKDLRIARESILKPLIERLDLEDVENVQKVTEICEKYINYVYNGVNGSNVVTIQDDIDWEGIAKGLNLAEPNGTNIKILNLIVDEYNKSHKASANPADILSTISNQFGKYPTNKASVPQVLETLTETIN